MSHNYPYRGSPEDFRSKPGTYATSDRLHGEQRDSCRSVEPSPRTVLAFTTSKSALETYSSQRSSVAENALSLLASCGLDPEDLSLLAGMPENLITIETLPRLLMEIKEKKARESHMPSHHRTASHLSAPPVSNAWRDGARVPSGERRYNSPQRSSYQLHHEWTASRPEHCSEAEQAGSVRRVCPGTRRGYVLDYNFGQLTAEKPRSDDRPVQSARAVGSWEPSANYQGLDRSRGPPAPYPRRDEVLSKTPSKNEASDFHGVMPQAFPYACSLCDITVLSERDWTLHINGSQHADSQLTVLQMYPDWDCRNDSNTKGDLHSKTKMEVEKTGRNRHAVTQRAVPRPASSEKHRPAKVETSSRVVCARFTAGSVDESCLMKLVKSFGTVVNISMFPMKAFLEMGSYQQAENIVKYYKNPAMIKGSQVQFSLSATFHFFQSSRVVSFSRLPPGKEKNSELVAIAKRFGPVKHSLFLPTRVFVEMTHAADAEKMVEHYTSHPLKMKGRNILVAFSTQHTTLKEDSPNKNLEVGERSSGYSHQSYSCETRTWSPSLRKSKEKEDLSHTTKEKSSRSSKSHSREGSANGTSREGAPESCRAQIRGDENLGVHISDNPLILTTQPAPSRLLKDTAVQIEGDLELVECPDSCVSKFSAKEQTLSPSDESRDIASIDHDTQDKAEPEEREHGGHFEVTDLDSDIEGMEVIGEDEEEKIPEEECIELEEGGHTDEVGPKCTSHEVLEPDPPEAPEVLEKEKYLKSMLNWSCQKRTSQNPGQASAEPVEERNHLASEEPVEEPTACKEEEPDFPESLEHCITLDELEEEEEEEKTLLSVDCSDKRDSSQQYACGKVIYIGNLPNHYYTDAQFVKIVRKYGKVNRYFLIRNRQEGFIEMESAADAQRAAEDLVRNPVEMLRSTLTIQLSQKYQMLTCGWSPEPASDEESAKTGNRGKRVREEQSRGRSQCMSKDDQDERPAKTACLREAGTPAEEPGSTGPQQQQDEKYGSPQPSMEVKNEDSNLKISLPSNSSGVQKSPEPDSGGPFSISRNETNKQIYVKEKEVGTKLDPVGREFVRPVVGYFCSLCNTIYVSEDEANNEHCSSMSHQQKYKEYLEHHRT